MPPGLRQRGPFCHVEGQRLPRAALGLPLPRPHHAMPRRRGQRGRGLPLPLCPEFVRRALIASEGSGGEGPARPDAPLHAGQLCPTAGRYPPRPDLGNEMNSISPPLPEQSAERRGLRNQGNRE